MPNSMKQTARHRQKENEICPFRMSFNFSNNSKKRRLHKNFSLKGKIEGANPIVAKELEDLRSENQTLRNQLEMTEEDYKALIDIMDRARKMVVSKEDGRMKKAAQET